MEKYAKAALVVVVVLAVVRFAKDSNIPVLSTVAKYL